MPSRLCCLPILPDDDFVHHSADANTDDYGDGGGGGDIYDANNLSHADHHHYCPHDVGTAAIPRSYQDNSVAVEDRCSICTIVGGPVGDVLGSFLGLRAGTDCCETAGGVVERGCASGGFGDRCGGFETGVGDALINRYLGNGNSINIKKFANSLNITYLL